MFPFTNLIPNVISEYLSLSISVRSDLERPFADFTSTGTRLFLVRTKKSSSRVEFSFL